MPDAIVPKLYHTDLSNGYATALEEGFKYIAANVHPSDRVFIKPNLTFPTYQPGVMTNPKLVEALIVYLKNYTNNISVCEADSGGYNPFIIDEVFERTGLKTIAKRYGVRLLNFSKEPAIMIPTANRLRKRDVPFPRIIGEECDIFITVPVFKVHLNTRISVALKNQWALIPIPAFRLKLHPNFAEVIYAINKRLPQALAIIDGLYGLTRTGPLRGDPVELNTLVISNDLFYTDLFAAHFMGVNPESVAYLAYALRNEGITDLHKLVTNCDLSTLPKFNFTLRREWTDYPGLACFNSRTLAYLGYESLLAKPLHWCLYRFREPFY